MLLQQTIFHLCISVELKVVPLLQECCIIYSIWFASALWCTGLSWSVHTKLNCTRFCLHGRGNPCPPADRQLTCLDCTRFQVSFQNINKNKCMYLKVFEDFFIYWESFLFIHFNYFSLICCFPLPIQNVGTPCLFKSSPQHCFPVKAPSILDLYNQSFQNICSSSEAAITSGGQSFNNIPSFYFCCQMANLHPPH